jgi:formylglycine-generating enzyme required for sulfatase activity
MKSVISLFCFFYCLIMPSCGKSSSIEMIYVEGGTFNPRKQQLVYAPQNIASFFVSKYEVTNDIYLEFVRDSGIEWIEDGYWGKRSELAPGPKNPAIYVSWLCAVKFCNWLSSRDGLTEAYKIQDNMVTWIQSSNGYRLPTESEWIWSASGGIKTHGYEYSGSSDPFEVGVFDHPSGTMQVGSKKPNELGIFDMSGNVKEWCWDIDPPSDDDIPSITRAKKSGLTFHLIYGGAYNYPKESICSIWTPGEGTEKSDGDNGFRIVRNAK